MCGGLGAVTVCEDWEVYVGLGIVGLVEDLKLLVQFGHGVTKGG